MTAALLLGACDIAPGPTGRDDAVTAGSPSIPTDPSMSAAQLADDDTTTLSEAQRLAALAAEPPTPGTDAGNGVDGEEVEDSNGDGDGDEPDQGAARPDPLDAIDTPAPAEPPSGEVDPEPALRPLPTTDEETPSVPTPVPAPSATDASTASGEFRSTLSPGFTGRLLEDGTVRLRWPGHEGARGYNIYRRSDYYTTVFATEYVDEDIHDGDYYYEIEAFDRDDRFTRIATGLTVEVRGLGRSDPNAAAANADLLAGYELVFADEFDAGALDTTKWNTSYLWGPNLVINSEEQYYVDLKNDPGFGYNPFTVENGALVINTVPTPESLRGKANGQPYLSGVITSYDSLQFTYGYAEARARLPYGRGFWPAFWLLNAYYVDDMPEIDIMEFLGHDQDTVFHTYHYHDADGTLRSTESEPTQGRDYTAGFHTFGVDWRPGLLVFYIDGVEVHRVADPKVSRQDMYVIANTAVGGWWAGSPDASTPFPGRYEIDYIRVYRQITPYGDPPFSDDDRSDLRPSPEVPGVSPNHRPPRELWPEGYPEGR